MKEKKRHRNLKWVILIIAVVTIVGTAVCYKANDKVRVVAYPEPTQQFFVEDYCGALNEMTERYIFDEAVKLYRATSAQVVVVTVNDLQGESLEDFSYELANQWGIGDKKKNNGVLILIYADEDEPHIRLEVGKGLEGAIPDGKAGRILDDYAVDKIHNGWWSSAAGCTFVAVAKEVYKEYGVEPSEKLTDKNDWLDSSKPKTPTFGDAVYPEAKYKHNDAPIPVQIRDALVDFLIGIVILLVVLVMVVVVIILLLLFSGSGGSRWSTRGGGILGGGSGGGFSGGGGSFGGGGASR